MKLSRGLFTIVATALLSLSFSSALKAQHNPTGWIDGRSFNILGPITHSVSCNGGGPGTMQQNWVAPFDMKTEDPQMGDEWEIDFGASPGTGYAGGHLTEVPTWFTIPDLEAQASLPAGTIPGGGDGVDAQGLFSWINDNLNIPPEGVDKINIPNDNTMFIATTYVANTTVMPKAVGICTASDDSILVMVNNVIVSTVSACRGWNANCQEINNVILPPGVSRLTMMVWEGGGGWGGRLGITIDGIRLADGNADGIVFLGPVGVGQQEYTVNRSVESLPFDADFADFATVTLTGGAESGNPSDVLTLVEHLTADDVASIEVDAPGALIEEIFPPGPEIAAIGDWADNILIGTDVGGGSASSVDGSTYTSTSTTGGDIWTGGDSFNFDYARAAGDFDISVRYESRTNDTASRSRWGKFGPMARKSLDNDSRFTMAQGTIHTNPGNAGENDGDRQAGRTVHRQANGGMYEDTLADPNARGDLGHPVYARITRRGNIFRAWFSNDVGVETDPTNDALWTDAGREDDWGGDSDGQPIYVGFANSDHGDGGANNQTVEYTIINLDMTPAENLIDPVPPLYVRVEMEATREELDAGLDYAVNYPPGGTVAISSPVPVGTNFITPGTTNIFYNPNQTGPIGAFDNSLDVGGPAVQGSTVFNPEDNSYTIVGQGADIWNGGDQFQFAYKEFTGDFVATVRVRHRGPNPTGRWGKHGIMARQSLAHNSRYSLAMTPTANTNGDPNAQDFSAHQIRINHLTNGSSNDQQRPPGIFDPDPDFDGTRQHPKWQRLIRKGQHFSVFFANDRDGAPGIWIPSGGFTHRDMPATVLLGIAQTSHGAQATTHVYDNWSVSTPVETPPADHFSPVALDDASFDFEAAPADMVVNSNNPGAFLPGVVDGRLRLLEDGVNSLGTTAWLPAPTLGDGTSLGDAGFRATFDAYFTALDGDGNPVAAPSNKADGATFAIIEAGLQDATGLFGGAGGAMGFAGGAMLTHTDTNEAQSLAIELDTWGSGGGGGDFDTGGTNNEGGRWHFGADASTSVVSAQNSGQFTGDGTTAGVPAAWDPATGGAHVEVQYLPIGDGMANVKVWASSNDDPVSFERKLMLDTCMPALTGELLFGFTGGSGGANMRFEVDNLEVSSFCIEAPDALDVAGDTEKLLGEDFDLTANFTGADGAVSYQWIVLNGPGTIVGSDADPNVTISSSETGTSVVRIFAEDELCGNRLVVNYEISWVCPTEGDTHCEGLEVVGDDEDFTGNYVMTATASDDSGDDISYTFTVLDSESNVVATIGPQADAVAEVELLEAGDYTISVSVDDSDLCDDPVGSCEVQITVLNKGGLQRPGDCNQDGDLDLGDALCLIEHIFLGRPVTLPCEGGTSRDPGNILLLDTNGDAEVDIADAVWNLTYLFLEPESPPVLGTDCVRMVGCPDACDL